MKDISDVRLLKLKGILFLLLGVTGAGLLIAESPNLKAIALLGVSVWAFCRFYYFAFYVLHHYADPSFQYAGLFHLFRYLIGKR